MCMCTHIYVLCVNLSFFIHKKGLLILSCFPHSKENRLYNHLVLLMPEALGPLLTFTWRKEAILVVLSHGQCRGLSRKGKSQGIWKSIANKEIPIFSSLWKRTQEVCSLRSPALGLCRCVWINKHVHRSTLHRSVYTHGRPQRGVIEHSWEEPTRGTKMGYGVLSYTLFHAYFFHLIHLGDLSISINEDSFHSWLRLPSIVLTRCVISHLTRLLLVDI